MSKLQWKENCALRIYPNVCPYHSSTSDSILLTGHIKLLKSLLSCQGVDKREVGRAVIPQFLTTYLFPASKLISEGGLTDTASGQTTSRSVTQMTQFSLL